MLRDNAARVIATAMISFLLQCSGSDYDGSLDTDGGKLDDGSSGAA